VVVVDAELDVVASDKTVDPDAKDDVDVFPADVADADAVVDIWPVESS